MCGVYQAFYYKNILFTFDRNKATGNEAQEELTFSRLVDSARFLRLWQGRGTAFQFFALFQVYLRRRLLIAMQYGGLQCLDTELISLGILDDFDSGVASLMLHTALLSVSCGVHWYMQGRPAERLHSGIRRKKIALVSVKDSCRLAS